MAPKPNKRNGPTPPRRYQSELRKHQAEQTRQRIVAAAAELFAADGYARTTLAKIAAAAGVSTETVQTHGPKAALMVAAVEYASWGVSGEENVLNLEMGRRFLDIENGDDGLEFLVSTQTEVHERGAGLAQALIGAAASDAELDGYLRRLSDSIELQARRILVVCRERGWLREDVSFDELVTTSAVVWSVDVFLRLTRQHGWSVTQYRTWLRRITAETIWQQH